MVLSTTLGEVHYVKILVSKESRLPPVAKVDQSGTVMSELRCATHHASNPKYPSAP